MILLFPARITYTQPHMNDHGNIVSLSQFFPCFLPVSHVFFCFSRAFFIGFAGARVPLTEKHKESSYWDHIYIETCLPKICQPLKKLTPTPTFIETYII